MSDQPLDLRKFLHILRRYWIVIGLTAVLGGLAGALYSLHNPPLASSSAVVEVSTASNSVTATQAVIADTDEAVLSTAVRQADPGLSMATMRKRVKATGLAPGVLSIRAEGTTAAQAERLADAVAQGYISYLGSSGKLQAQMVSPATVASGWSLLAALITSACIGGLGGMLIGSIGSLAFGRRDLRLRRRDEIANAIGVPVVASMLAEQRRTSARWRKLLESYSPGASDAWRLRGALHQLRLADGAATQIGSDRGRSLTVISFSSDRSALGLGPQLAVYTASLGLQTLLAIGPQQDASATAALRAACAALAASSWRKGNLRLAVADNAAESPQLPEAVVTVVVAVVDARAPRFESAIRTSAAVLAVSAGTATADDLARVAASAGAAGLEVSGILVANPDERDPTTGRVPHIGRAPQQLKPLRLTGTTTEAGQ
jgi:capsular polysaccharide biosynthesis protein